MEWNAEALDDEVMERPLDALVGASDSRIIDRPDWHQVVTPSFTSGGLNGVSRCRVGAEALNAAIDAAVDEYTQLGLRWRWTVGPRSTPGLAMALRQRGLAEHAITGLWRAADLPARRSAPVVAAQVTTSSDLDAFTAVMAAGWNTPAAPLGAYNRLLLEAPTRQRLFLARVDGVPAGSAGLAIVERSVYLIGAVVLPAFRGRGVYRALLDARCALARELGKALVTCQAKPETSAPILESLGFQSIGSFPVFTPVMSSVVAPHASGMSGSR